MNMAPMVSIIIVNWNGLDQLKTCLPLLFNQAYKNFEVIIVDNNSKDASVTYITHTFKNVIVIRCTYNSGFAEGCNIGLGKAKGKYILLLNNDTQVSRKFLTILVQEIEKQSEVAIVQPKIIFKQSKKLQAGCSYLTNTGFLYYYGYSKNPKEKKYNKQQFIFSANGSCMLIRAEVIKKIGLFDADYFAYFEETDFCWRVWLHGYKILYVPQAEILHAGAQTSRLLPSTFVGFHSFKNRINSLIKNLEVTSLIRILPMHIVLCEIYAFINLTKGKLQLFLSIQQAIGWNIRNIKKTLNKRSIIQKKYRKVSDSQMFTTILKKVTILYYYYLSKNLEEYEDHDL